MRRFVLQLTSIATIVCACSDDQGPRPLGPNAVTQTVTSAGATLTSKDGLVRVDVPAGAVATGRTITLDERSLTEADPALRTRNIVRLYELGPSGSTFDKPIRVSIKTAQQPVISDSSVIADVQALLTVENGAAVPLNNQELVVTAAGVTVTGELTHFSPLALEGETVEVDVTFANVPDQAQVRRPFNTQLVAVTRGPIPATLLGLTYHDQSTIVVPRPALPAGTSFPSRDNRILEQVPYQCDRTGPGLFRPEVNVFLEHPQFTSGAGQRYTVRMGTRGQQVDCVARTEELRVGFSGDGSGRVAVAPQPAATCDATCALQRPEGENVTITVLPNADSRFAGFSGDCGPSEFATVAAPVQMSGPRLCVVTFMKKPVHPVTIRRTGLGTGTVTGGGLNCGDNCTILVPEGTALQLRATPATGSRFEAWLGPNCPAPDPNNPDFIVPVDGPVSCDVFFPFEQVGIEVAPSAPTLDVGTVQRLNVVLSDEAGTVSGRNVTFLSDNPSVATVDAQGNVTAVSGGFATIVVTVAGPGGGVVNVVVTVRETIFPLLVRKTGPGQGTTSIFNPGTGVSSDFCDLDCPQVSAGFRQGSVLHVLASPGAGSTLVGFLGDCAAIGSTPTAAVQMDNAETCTVEFGLEAPPGPLSIAFGGLTSKTTGLSVSISSVSGTVYADYDVQNYPRRPDSLSLTTRLGGRSAATCFKANLTGSRVRCEIDTGASDSSFGINRGQFLNGLRTLSLTARNQSGVTVATVDQPLTLNNQSFLRMTTNNPPGTTPTTWRGGEIAITIRPVIFDDINTDNLSIDLVPTGPLTGTGTLTFDGGPGNDAFVFTANPANSPTAQGSFGGNIIVFDGGGNDITGIFGSPPPFQQNIDMVPPNVPSMSMPSNTFISGGVLVLDFATGPYPAGERIALNRISGGSVIGAHQPFCGSAHVHGTINIRRANSSSFDGPFSDPRLGADCGHGVIVTENFSNVLFSFGASVQEPNPITTNVLMLNGQNGCDVFPTDDIPILLGTGPGQASNPNFTTSNNPFNFISSLNVNSSMANQDVCFRIRVQDSAVGADGLPSNVVNRRLQSRLVPFVPPPPQ